MWELVTEGFLQALSDPVPNVRLTACKLLSQVDIGEKEMFISKLVELSNDTDLDTAILARAAVET